MTDISRIFRASEAFICPGNGIYDLQFCTQNGMFTAQKWLFLELSAGGLQTLNLGNIYGFILVER